MYYFKINDEYLNFIDIHSANFDPSLDLKIRLEFNTKPLFSIKGYDIEGNLYPIKKSSLLYKNVINALLDKNWHMFEVDDMPVESIVNQEYEEKEPFCIFFPEKQKKVKINPYEKWNTILKYNNLPIISTEDEVFYKKSINTIYHIYYRKEDTIIHAYFNEFEFILVDKEIFKKVI